MFRTSILAASLALCAAPASAAPEKAFDLMVGDKAPALEVGGWVKGNVPAFQEGTVYVVEFWATWCGPCRKAIPHMSELAEQYKPKNVEFVGVSIWESDPGEGSEEGQPHARVQELVTSFVEGMGEKMSYTVAYDRVPAGAEGYDGGAGAMARGWMFAAGQQGIPTAFIVNRKGTVAWIGSPFSIDEPLKQIADETWDLDKAIAQHQKDMKPRAVEFKLRSKIQTAMEAGNVDAAVAALDEAFAASPEMEASWGVQKMMLLAGAGRADEAFAYGNKLVEGVLKDNVGGLNYVAWLIVDPDSKLEKRDVELALRASKRSNELTEWKDPALLDTYAAAQFMAGAVDQAIKWQEEAVKHAKGMPYEQELVKRLEEYRAKSGSAG
jgi:thiol-disulfide isomerase/thioredoxin